jgi:hypothetical protein
MKALAGKKPLKRLAYNIGIAQGPCQKRGTPLTILKLMDRLSSTSCCQGSLRKAFKCPSTEGNNNHTHHFAICALYRAALKALVRLIK